MNEISIMLSLAHNTGGRTLDVENMLRDPNLYFLMTRSWMIRKKQKWQEDAWEPKRC